MGPGRVKGYDVLRQLRAAGVSADAPFEERPLKAQLRMADRAGARFALILGEQEVAEGTVTVRRMEDGHQERVPATDVPTWISAQA
jgi:histidyl-tRNA synthetase